MPVSAHRLSSSVRSYLSVCPTSWRRSTCCQTGCWPRPPSSWSRPGEKHSSEWLGEYMIDWCRPYWPVYWLTIHITAFLKRPQTPRTSLDTVTWCFLLLSQKELSTKHPWRLKITCNSAPLEVLCFNPVWVNTAGSTVHNYKCCKFLIQLLWIAVQQFTVGPDIIPCYIVEQGRVRGREDELCPSSSSNPRLPSPAFSSNCLHVVVAEGNMLFRTAVWKKW